MTREYDEIILVFDMYKDVSMEYATREARLQGQRPIQYHIHDETRIKRITIKRLLSIEKTKADIADNIAQTRLWKSPMYNYCIRFCLIVINTSNNVGKPLLHIGSLITFYSHSYLTSQKLHLI